MPVSPGSPNQFRWYRSGRMIRVPSSPKSLSQRRRLFGPSCQVAMPLRLSLSCCRDRSNTGSTISCSNSSSSCSTASSSHCSQSDESMATLFSALHQSSVSVCSDSELVADSHCVIDCGPSGPVTRGGAGAWMVFQWFALAYMILQCRPSLYELLLILEPQCRSVPNAMARSVARLRFAEHHSARRRKRSRVSSSTESSSSPLRAPQESLLEGPCPSSTDFLSASSLLHRSASTRSCQILILSELCTDEMGGDDAMQEASLKTSMSGSAGGTDEWGFFAELEGASESLFSSHRDTSFDAVRPHVGAVVSGSCTNPIATMQWLPPPICGRQANVWLEPVSEDDEEEEFF
jgi:hypothetical protein